ncbi:putative mannan endo-1,4-beta-mannosidase 9 [Physcomitrium patens]|uniref:mannan endo-1,4-beta-mannosidase n=1 Tax=Physcomitrium patens TaxID=3218 RepID=A0A2K1L3K9_PHYPA|nr:putative mannan endo-1,4-beta-mannosidase 9 [Physcomitrium patens]PNR60614.1 hypothetical protein PHYPA_003407 [Physcomitrium patens]|eukprot:XP_024359301.1 putative mannan endo-1,4-beta-mannosidase 9 [Physcomitrella patens]
MMKILCWRFPARIFSVSILLLVSLLLPLPPKKVGALRPKNEFSFTHHVHNTRHARRHVKAVSSDSDFVNTRGHQFTVNGKALYVNGANIYWLMSMGTEESTRSVVTDVLTEAAAVGVTVVRTWAFADGSDYHPLQKTPGMFDESTFQGLDFAISEAKKHGIWLILSLVNNYADYGGKPQYVEWANTYAGTNLTSEDDFFSDATIRAWFKDYIRTIVTRVNTIGGVAYRDEPAIFAWELMNEPRCGSDPTGNVFQAWLEEMALYVKSLDTNHMLEVGLEGFYSSAVSLESVDRESSNPGTFATQYGVDFIRNQQISALDFASVHSYPDNWTPSLTEAEKRKFMVKWIQTHINDSETTLQKPVLFAEFGKSSRTSGYKETVRIDAMRSMFNAVYDSAAKQGAAAGAMVWMLVTNSTKNTLADGFEIDLSSDLAIASLMQNQASRMSSLS